MPITKALDDCYTINTQTLHQSGNKTTLFPTVKSYPQTALKKAAQEANKLTILS
jgi:hypothetical protein